MGRPLNKKYFGNRNVGADGTYETSGSLTPGAEIGGEGIDHFTTIVAGSGWTVDPISQG